MIGPNEQDDDKSSEYAPGDYVPTEAEQEWLDHALDDDSFGTPSNTER